MEPSVSSHSPGPKSLDYVTSDQACDSSNEFGKTQIPQLPQPPSKRKKFNVRFEGDLKSIYTEKHRPYTFTLSVQKSSLNTSK